jgi:aminodeoxyfutalosine synthase
VAHELGLNTNATILYGHIETIDDRLRHMELLRCEQDRALTSWVAQRGIPIGDDGSIVLRDGNDLPVPDETSGYYQTIIPLPFIPDDSALGHLPGPGGEENLRMLAICRLMLDNIPHVKTFWIMQTLAMAEVMLQAGADDIDGTVVWYDITKVGGSDTHQETDAARLQRAIRDAGFEPVERDTLYRPIRRDGAEWELADARAFSFQV